MDRTLPLDERVENIMTQIGDRLSYASQPMHVILQGIIDEALDTWSMDADDRAVLQTLISLRINVPNKSTHIPVVRLPDVDVPVEPTTWDFTW